MSKLFLGVDGGGSHTKISIIDKNEKILSQIEGHSTNLNILSPDIVLENLTTLINKAVEKLDFDELHGCFALSGVNFPSDLKIWQGLVAKQTKLISLFTNFPFIINDTRAALRSGTTNEDAAVIISGTGSNCYGRNSKGEQASCGGEDYILSDQGSGYSIGLEILHAVTKYLDQRGPKTTLTDQLFKTYKIKNLEQLSKLVYSKPWNKTDIAQVGSLLETSLQSQDQVALEILQHNVEELIKMVIVVIKTLKLEDKNFDLITSGSVLIKNTMFRQKFVFEVEKIYPNAKLLKPNIGQSEAAALLARELSFNK